LEACLAVREPHKGAVVKSLTMDELVQTYEVRILLEVEAARRGASAVTDADCRAMSRLCDQLVQGLRRGQDRRGPRL
jgi:DNA-binding GntR family transcriptional regulator